MFYHDPVMVSECISGLECKPDGIYVDVTFGGGGHSKAILQRLGPTGRLVAFDQDDDAIQNAISDERLILIRDNFRNMNIHLGQHGFIPVNGILADLGVSSHQFDIAERGFSIRFEHELDMRMDQRSGQTALDVLNTYTEKDLVKIFSAYGEVRNSKSLAAAIVKARNVHPFTGSSDLRSAIAHLVPVKEATGWLAQVYQALRIEVNGELNALKSFLEQASAALVPGGRLVVMSYHSLEDRLVKNFISKGNFEGEEKKDLYGNNTGLLFRPIAKKAIVPSDEEIKRNPRSRSARLRIAEKL